MNEPARADVLMYATAHCPYCTAARDLLERRGIPFREIDVAADAKARREMTARSRRQTVPQIFIGGRHVGGYDDLAALDRSGQLDTWLAGTGASNPGGAGESVRNESK